jgi:hypothetical protein
VSVELSLDAGGGVRPLAARIALASAGAVVLLIAALHVVKPELDPSWRFLSEYSIGPNGWLMKLAFLAWAIGCLALFVALGGETAPLRAKAGRWVLLVVGLALVGASLFDQDATTAKEATLTGTLHAVTALIGIPGTPLAAMLLSADRRGGRTVVILANLTWVCLVAMVGYIGWAMSTKGGFGPGVYAGWLNRLVVLAYIGWQAALAQRLLRVG